MRKSFRSYQRVINHSGYLQLQTNHSNQTNPRNRTNQTIQTFHSTEPTKPIPNLFATIQPIQPISKSHPFPASPFLLQELPQPLFRRLQLRPALVAHGDLAAPALRTRVSAELRSEFGKWLEVGKCRFICGLFNLKVFTF